VVENLLAGNEERAQLPMGARVESFGTVQDRRPWRCWIDERGRSESL
jgi:hypothetical protein